MQSFVVWNCLTVSMVSLVCSAMFAWLRKAYSSRNPIALYRFSFRFGVMPGLWKSEFVHSHGSVQRAFAALIGLRKASLVIVDQCSEVIGCMKVEGRILRDGAREEGKGMALMNVQRDSARLKELL